MAEETSQHVEHDFVDLVPDDELDAAPDGSPTRSRDSDVLDLLMAMLAPAGA